MNTNLPAYMNPRSWDRPEIKTDVKGIGSQAAQEHPLMARRVEIAQIVDSMKPTSKVEGAQLPANIVMSIVQRRDEQMWTWTPAVTERGEMPLWVPFAISEVLGTPDLRLLPDPDHPGYGKLYRRALSDRLVWDEPVSWVPVPDLRITYGGGTKETIPGFDSWMKDWLYRAGITITQGMTFICEDGAIRGEYQPDRKRWVRTIVTADGTVTSTVRDRHTGRDIPVDPVRVDIPTTYTVKTHETVEDTLDVAGIASDILTLWSGRDGKSDKVLRLMCASMFMRSHPEQCYVVQGPGGTGKSTFTKDLKEHLGLQAMDLSLDLLASPTAMSAENAMLELSRHLLALTDDYDPRYGRFNKILPALKPLTTGSLPFAARQRGADSVVDATPQAVHVITTNYHLPIDDSAAEQRRFMFANILDQNVLNDSYIPFRADYGFWPFMLSGMLAWYELNGDHTGLGNVSYVDLTGLSDQDIQIIRTVITDGYVCPDPTLRGVRWQGLGLKRTCRRIDGKTANVYAPMEDSPLYATWLQCRAAVESIPAQSMEQTTDVENLAPLDVDPVEWAREKSMGGETGLYVPAGGGKDGKVAHDWQKTIARGDGLEAPDFDRQPIWAQVAGRGEIVIDWDADHDGDGQHGLNRMEEDMGVRMGSPDLPTPFLERSARGGYHGAYGVPAWLIPYFKKSANGRSVSGDPTLLVDTKLAEGGYVIAVGSHTPLGVYSAVRRPVGGRRPDLTQPMLEWLERHGYLDKPLPESYTGLDGCEHHGLQPSETRPRPQHRPGHVDTGHAHMGGGRPDMKPIPEGARNDTLYRWGFGRHAKYPDNCASIDRDMVIRGRASGLKDREITAIIKSVHSGTANADA